MFKPIYTRCFIYIIMLFICACGVETENKTTPIKNNDPGQDESHTHKSQINNNLFHVKVAAYGEVDYAFSAPVNQLQLKPMLVSLQDVVAGFKNAGYKQNLFVVGGERKRIKVERMGEFSRLLYIYEQNQVNTPSGLIDLYAEQDDFKHINRISWNLKGDYNKEKKKYELFNIDSGYSLIVLASLHNMNLEKAKDIYTLLMLKHEDHLKKDINLYSKFLVTTRINKFGYWFEINTVQINHHTFLSVYQGS